jgi:hypothetical protein
MSRVMVSDTTYTVRRLTVQVPSVRGFQSSYGLINAHAGMDS